MGAWGAAADNDAIQILRLDQLANAGQRFPRAPVSHREGRFHPGQPTRVLGQCIYRNNAPDIVAAIADEYADTRIFAGDVLFGRVIFCGLRRCGKLLQVARGQAGGRARLDHGFRDVFGAFEQAADVNAGPGSGHGVKPRRSGKGMFVELDAETLRKRNQIGGDSETGGQDDHIEGIGPQAGGRIGGVADGKIFSLGVAHDAVGSTPDQLDSEVLAGARVVKFIVFAEGPHVHKKDGRFDIALEAFLGHQGFFKRDHAADA